MYIHIAMHKSMLEKQLKRFESMGREMRPSDRKKVKTDSSAVVGTTSNVDNSKTALALERAAAQGSFTETFVCATLYKFVGEGVVCRLHCVRGLNFRFRSHHMTNNPL